MQTSAVARDEGYSHPPDIHRPTGQCRAWSPRVRLRKLGDRGGLGDRDVVEDPEGLGGGERTRSGSLEVRCHGLVNIGTVEQQHRSGLKSIRGDGGALARARRLDRCDPGLGRVWDAS